MVRGLFSEKPVYRKFLILVGVILLSSVIFFIIAAFLTKTLYGVDVAGNPAALQDLDNPMVIQAMKLLQFLTTGIGMFLFPSLVAAYLFSRTPMTYLKLDKTTPVIIFILTIIIMFAAVPAINMMLFINQQMELPTFLAGIENWMKSSEESAEKITEVFLATHSIGELFYNLFIIALLPALGEEFLFRGLIQKLFKDLTKNIHWAIFLSAVLFSAIHMQFYGFLPRMMLGILFGYLLYWTGSLWVPVLAHFINNGAAIVFSYLSEKNQMPFNHDTIGSGADQGYIAAISVVTVIIILLAIHYIMKKEKLSMLTNEFLN